MSATMMVRVAGGDSRTFAKHVANAKALHGKFDGATKTWAIPMQMVECIGGVDALKVRGLIPVQKTTSGYEVRGGYEYALGGQIKDGDREGWEFVEVINDTHGLYRRPVSK